jgi:hypothetical protein
MMNCGRIVTGSNPAAQTVSRIALRPSCSPTSAVKTTVQRLHQLPPHLQSRRRPTALGGKPPASRVRKLSGQPSGAVFEAHRGPRRLGAGCSCWPCWQGRTLVGFVVVDPDLLCGAGEPVGQHGDGGLPREPWIGAIEPERQIFEFPCPPHDGHRRCSAGKGEGLWKSFMPAVPGWISQRETPRCASGSPVAGAAKLLRPLPLGAR